MPKKIENPLREGLPSKIYLLAYGEPLTAYEMAKRIYGIKPPELGERAQIPATAKVSVWVKTMKTKGILSENRERKTFSKSEPLLDEIVKTLKDQNVELSDLEKHMINAIIDSREFRGLLIKTVGVPLGHHDGPIWVSHDIDSAWIIMNILAPFASLVSQRKKAQSLEFQPKTLKEFDEKLNFVSRFWKSKEFKIILDEMREEVINPMKIVGPNKNISEEEVLNIIKISVMLSLIPTSTLEKLGKLSFINQISRIPVEFVPFRRLEKILGKEVGRIKTRGEKKLSKVPEWEKRRAR